MPTLAHQIARIYERDLQSHLYSGSTAAGQSFVHKEDMTDAFVRAIERRRELPPELTLLVGEEDAPSYDELQDMLGRLIHGEKEWATISVPKWAAKAGAGLQVAAEPLIPDSIDRGEKPSVITPEESRAVVAAILKAEQSARENRAVEF